MRIDPKYFNRFIAVCAVITAIVIVYSTIRYFDRQVSDFEQNASEIRTDTLSFRSFSGQDSLRLNQVPPSPTIIHFWSTCSDKSLLVGKFLKSYKKEETELNIIAAAVRDGDKKILEFIEKQQADFHFVEGTDLYQTLLAPGLPTQLFLDSSRTIVDTHVGDDTTEIRHKLERLFKE